MLQIFKSLCYLLVRIKPEADEKGTVVKYPTVDIEKKDIQLYQESHGRKSWG